MASVDVHTAPAEQPAPKGVPLVRRLVSLYGTVFGALERATSAWLPGLLARFTFAAVLFGYYWNAAQTKLDGGLFSLSVGAYAQIVPPVIEATGYDVSQVALPWTLLVYAGTYAEFLLPILVVIGLFGRLSALGMIGFVVVQSYVDVAFHGVADDALGAWFDRFQNSIILDQRLLWVFPLTYLVLKGPGLLSADALAGRIMNTRG
ncbi:MAG: DoxX family protein [Devosiaceae bacterium]|nr:DoxX family protein [Devosiaceae bacterium MH13]